MACLRNPFLINNFLHLQKKIFLPYSTCTQSALYRVKSKFVNIIIWAFSGCKKIAQRRVIQSSLTGNDSKKKKSGFRIMRLITWSSFSLISHDFWFELFSLAEFGWFLASSFEWEKDELGRITVALECS
jgi:hypothetical protein